MENEEMLEQANDTENEETQTSEEIGEGIELTDTTDDTESEKEEVTEEKEEVKTFTQEEVDEIVRKRLARAKRDSEKELSKYKNVEAVLNAGLGTHSIEEAESNLRSYYKEQGIDIPEASSSGLSTEDLQLLGDGDAKKILDLGLEEAEEEANRLAQKGRANWSAREEATFNKLASALTYEKQKKELKTIGADPEILDSKEFNDFKNKFNYGTDIKEIYKLYSKTDTKKPKILGSMKNTNPEKIAKEFTIDDLNNLTLDDLDDEETWNKARKFMTNQK